MSLPDDDLLVLLISQNINREPPGTKNNTSMDIFFEYGYARMNLEQRVSSNIESHILIHKFPFYVFWNDNFS